MKIQVIVDRIEENKLAVLEIEGRAGDFTWPVEFLPPGVHEGSILNFTIELDPVAEAKQRAKIKKLQEELIDKGRDKG